MSNICWDAWKSHLCSLQPQVLLEQPLECGLEEGLLGLIYVLVTAEALDTALCFTRHWCLHRGLASPLFWGRKVSLLFGVCWEERVQGFCYCTFVYIIRSWIMDFCHSSTLQPSEQGLELGTHWCMELHVLSISSGLPAGRIPLHSDGKNKPLHFPFRPLCQFVGSACCL